MMSVITHNNFSGYLQDLADRKSKSRRLEHQDDVLRRMFGFIDHDSEEVVEVTLVAVHDAQSDTYREVSELFGLDPDKLKQMMTTDEGRKQLIESLPLQG